MDGSYSTRKAERKVSGPRKLKKPGSPRRPLSAYNIFFKVQRNLIIQNKPDIADTKLIDKMIDEFNKNPPVKKKRLHRKSHGKIGFAELAKTISKRWKKCTLEIKQHFESLAVEEKRRYYDELLVYRVNQLASSVKNDQSASIVAARRAYSSTDNCEQAPCPVPSIPPSLILSPCPSQSEMATDLEPLPLTHDGDSFSLIDRGVCDFLLSAFAKDEK